MGAGFPGAASANPRSSSFLIEGRGNSVLREFMESTGLTLKESSSLFRFLPRGCAILPASVSERKRSCFNSRGSNVFNLAGSAFMTTEPIG